MYRKFVQSFIAVVVVFALFACAGCGESGPTEQPEQEQANHQQQAEPVDDRPVKIATPADANLAAIIEALMREDIEGARDILHKTASSVDETPQPDTARPGDTAPQGPAIQVDTSVLQPQAEAFWQLLKQTDLISAAKFYAMPEDVPAAYPKELGKSVVDKAIEELGELTNSHLTYIQGGTFERVQVGSASKGTHGELIARAVIYFRKDGRTIPLSLWFISLTEGVWKIIDVAQSGP